MNSNWDNYIEKTINDSIEAKKKLLPGLQEEIKCAARQLLDTFNNEGKLLLCGNGGSAADAQHIAAELIVRLKTENDRPAIPAISLSVDTSILTACGNDYRFDLIFSRQIEALGDRCDTLIAISTSGNSTNMIEAVNMAHEKGLYVIGLLGGSGGKLSKLVDLPIIVPSASTARIQECHMLIAHILCDLVEEELYPLKSENL